MVSLLFYCKFMDVPKLLVFINNKKPTPIQEVLLKKLFELGFSPMVDSIHTDSYTWFKNNVKPVSHKLFSFEEDAVLFYEVDELDPKMIFVPEFLIYFNQDSEIPISHWVCIRFWLQYILFDNSVETDFVLRGQELMVPPTTSVSNSIDVPMTKTGNDYYSFKKEWIKVDDIMLYEVQKPFTDLPYTSVLRNFSLKGVRPFFTSLYVCSSWGVSRHDLVFLKELWVHEFNLDIEEFNIDLMLKEATEACYPQPGMIPELEPEVYRRDIEHVKQVLQEQKEGRLCTDHQIPFKKKEKILKSMGDAFVNSK